MSDSRVWPIFCGVLICGMLVAVRVVLVLTGDHDGEDITVGLQAAVTATLALLAYEVHTA